MSSPRCPQCNQPLPDRAVACKFCGYDGSEAKRLWTSRLLTLALLFALAVCIAGACVVWFRGGDSSQTQKVIGELIFAAGFVLYAITRVLMYLRQRRHPR